MKMSQVDTENDIFPIIFQFSEIFRIFSKFSTDFVGWNIESVNKKRMCCPVGFYEEFIAVF